MSDPTAMLRCRQCAEYQKLCQELRLRENTAVLGKLAPPSAKDDDGQCSKASNTSRRSSIAEVMSMCPNDRPHDYDFTSLYLGDKQLRPLAAALAVDRQLVCLRLPGVGMFDNGMVAVCTILKRSPQMEVLDVSGNRFSTLGARACVGLAEASLKLREVVAKDTALDADFAFKRGLPTTVTAARLALEAILAPRKAAAAAAGVAEDDRGAGAGTTAKAA